MTCGWEVLRGTWLVVCYGVDFLVLWVSHICSRICIFNQTAEKKIPFHTIWGLCWYNLFFWPLEGVALWLF